MSVRALNTIDQCYESLQDLEITLPEDPQWRRGFEVKLEHYKGRKSAHNSVTDYGIVLITALLARRTILSTQMIEELIKDRSGNFDITAFGNAFAVIHDYATKGHSNGKALPGLEHLLPKSDTTKETITDTITQTSKDSSWLMWLKLKKS